MPAVRIATFNAENLFARFKFREDVDPETATERGWTANETLFDTFSSAEKSVTGAALKALDADVVALQEIENLDTLRKFRRLYLGGPQAYPYSVLIEGNDPRLIDVALLSRHPITHVRSYQHEREGRGYIFSRDCLEATVSVGGKDLTLFVNHLKSMLDMDDPANGRANTRDKRRLQSAKIRQIIETRYGANPGAQAWAVLGDLNDYVEPGGENQSGIVELIRWNQAVDVVKRRPPDDQWTHWWDKGNDYRQLDYILLSASLAQASPKPPEIFRKGMPRNARAYAGERLPEIEASGRKSLGASDHCPVVMEVQLE